MLNMGDGKLIDRFLDSMPHAVTISNAYIKAAESYLGTENVKYQKRLNMIVT